MAKLIIKRANELANRFNSFELLINETPVLKIKNGETKTLDWNAGTYTLRCKMGSYGSETLPVTLTDQTPCTLEVGSLRKDTILQKILSITGFVVLFGGIFYFKEITLLMWIAIIGIWIVRDVILTGGKPFIYYLFRGRSKYLYLRQL